MGCYVEGKLSQDAMLETKKKLHHVQQKGTKYRNEFALSFQLHEVYCLCSTERCVVAIVQIESDSQQKQRLNC